jgi:tRNA-specific 2-thiouridylase
MKDATGTVLMAMSGGVDSSVAAARLVERGWEVKGVFMCLSRGETHSRGCCSPADAADARRVAQHLGIDLHVLPLADAFEPIIAQFAQEYLRGRTPNPCIHCNARIKFGRLVRLADQLGIQRVATGHYARVLQDAEGKAWIHRGLSASKDQSYALFAVEPKALDRMLLPIGVWADKKDLREEARQRGLIVHDKPDSQEICFAPEDDYLQVLQARVPEALRPGEIVDAQGNVLGYHEGYARYTIGQRRGLGIAAAEPLYVTRIDPESRRVTIGPKDQVMGTQLLAQKANWHGPVPDRFEATVQIRYNHSGAPARVTRTDSDAFRVEFDEAVHAITPGQAAVVYRGDRLLGGGWIVRGQ